MENYLNDWLNLLLRWLHIIVGIAWIGSSFLFVWLDNSLTRPKDPELLKNKVDGELWMVHGGGFYHAQKYFTAPGKMPEHLHWFYWESYWTWMSGFALFVTLYLFNPTTFLIDPKVAALAPWQAVSAALAFLIVGYAVYDLICRTLGQRANGDRSVGALVIVYVIAAAYLACHVFAGRAAFLIVGAMLATIMTANVVMLIIPGQRKVVAALRAGLPPDPLHGKRAKQRSVHNTYFTLPVLFTMLSNHYPMTFSHAHNWLVLLAIMLAGAIIREFFVRKHKGVKSWGLWVLAAAILAALAVAIAPVSSGTKVTEAPSSARVQEIVNARCVMCHNPQVNSKNVQLHTDALIAQHAAAIHQQAVLQRLMPMNNATQMSEDERAQLAAWFRSLSQK